MLSIIYLNYDRKEAKLFAERLKDSGLADVDYANSMRELFDKLRKRKFNIIIIRMNPGFVSILTDGIKRLAEKYPDAIIFAETTQSAFENYYRFLLKEDYQELQPSYIHSTEKLPALLFPVDLSNEEKRQVIRFVIEKMAEPGMTKILKNSPMLMEFYRILKEKRENT
ncbi:MAG: hypothetical protein B6D65_00740 [candidate division Zixibacteria bacterium 4484_93]|mgnify:CR=1 FL=1|nr:MAG: hypothetical protein B6D65_00740 [candidate division Zixibacteria bacterium 4484_93]